MSDSNQPQLSPFFPSEQRTRGTAGQKMKLEKGQTVASLLIELLVQAGVREIFGVAGDALNGLTDQLRRDGRIRWIGCRHEENAAYAAYASAELTGNLGVCAGTVGPGALHLLNGLYNAKREGAAVLAITGQVPTHERGTDYFQEVDLTKVFDDVTGFQAAIGSASQMLRLTELAIQKSLGEKCVSRLEIPIDVMTMKIENLDFYHPLVKERPLISPREHEIESARELIAKAKKIAILAGIGCRGARDEVLALSDRIQAPISHTLRAKDLFEGRHPNVVGLTGLIGAPPAYHAILDCDLLIMLGTNFPYENFLPVDVPIIQIDQKIENLGRRAPVSLGIVGTVKESVRALLDRVPIKPDNPFLDHLRKMQTKTEAHFLEATRLENDREPLHPALITKVISDLATDDAVFSIDVGESTVWAARYLRLRGSQRMIGSFNHGSMGCALPIAIGASASFPTRQCWAFCGDGGFAMSMQDLVTASRFKWPVKAVVFNNSELGFVKMENEVAGFPLDDAATGLVNPNFADLAKACGAVGIRVEHARDIREAVLEAARETRPVVLDVIVSPGELTLPPHVGIAQAWGFGLSKVKEGLLGIKGDHAQWENWKRELQAALK